jgi:hypothetical protein
LSGGEFLKLAKEKAGLLKMDMEMLKRQVNVGFSGGEKKRAEMVQMGILDPAFAVLDETDSGLDIDALRIVGAGINGGCMYAHSSGEYARGDVRDVQCTVFVGPESVGMVYSNEDGLGPEGQIILPEVTGILHQFNNVGFKGFWGFGRVSENRIVRVEHGSSFQSIGH